MPSKMVVHSAIGTREETCIALIRDADHAMLIRNYRR